MPFILCDLWNRRCCRGSGNLLLIYFLFAKELFNKGQDLEPEQCTSLFTYYFGKAMGIAV